MTIEPEIDLLAGLRSGAWLDEQRFDHLEHAVDSIIPEGMTLLVAAPKIGKSWLQLGVSLAVAEGGVALGGIEVEARPVLYLALEDGDRRMQARCRTLLRGRPIPPTFDYLTTIQPGEVLATVKAWLERHPDTKPLITIDTLGRVMPPPRVGESAYQHDYRVAAALKRLADSRPGSALVIVHHDRKAGTADFVEKVSGTNGLAGAADTIVVLDRERHATTGTLNVTGRDVHEATYAITFDDGTWHLDGDSLEEARKSATEVRAASGLDERSGQILAYVNDTGEVDAKTVAEALGLSNDDTGKYLRRLHTSGRIAKPGRGRYAPLVAVSEVSERPNGNTPTTTPLSDVSEAFGHSDGSDTPTYDDEYLTPRSHP